MTTSLDSTPSKSAPSADTEALRSIAELDLLKLMRSGRILVTGAGVSGRGAVAMLQDIGCREIVLVDDNVATAEKVAADFGITTVTTTGAAELVNSGSVAGIVTSPGWRPDTSLFQLADAKSIPVVGDVAVAFAADQGEVWGPARTWLVVTGTNGKTTTTSMLADMLGERGAAVGNIGVALHDAMVATPRIDVLAAELSSFQLHWAPNLRPHAGVLLNLAEDHIDWHGSYANYGADKAQALTGAIAIYGADDADVVEQVEALDASGQLASKVVSFTDSEPSAHQLGVRDGNIVDCAFTDDGDIEQGVVIAPATGISPPGRAGVLDALAATALARAVGVTPADISAALAGFQVRAHRGQIVHESSGVVWIDDSKATNPHAADAALGGHEKVVWVVGGQLKGADIGPLIAKHAHRLQSAIVLGADANIIIDQMRRVAPAVPVVHVSETDKTKAMRAVCESARDAAHEGDVVLLAPAAASLDMYTGMAERGDLFAQFAREATKAL